MSIQATYPAFYIEEVPSGVRAVKGVLASIAAFIDFFREGPMDEAMQIFGMADFDRVYDQTIVSSPVSPPTSSL